MEKKLTSNAFKKYLYGLPAEALLLGVQYAPYKTLVMLQQHDF